MPAQLAYIGLGANLGDARATLLAATQSIAAIPGVAVLQCSPLYGSAALPPGAPDYVNAVLVARSALAPLELLHALQRIEQQAGRERPYPNAPRTLDLDLLLYGSAQSCSAELTLPHPRIYQRAFVLRPLADIAPALVSAEQLRAVQAQAIWPL